MSSRVISLQMCPVLIFCEILKNFKLKFDFFTVRLWRFIGSDCQTPNCSRHHLPQPLQRWFIHRSHRQQERLVRQLRFHAGLQRPQIHRAYASVFDHPQVSPNWMIHLKTELNDSPLFDYRLVTTKEATFRPTPSIWLALLCPIPTCRSLLDLTDSPVCIWRI